MGPTGDDDPVAIGDSIAGVVSSLRATRSAPTSARAVGGLFRGWADAVGPNVAAHARPVVLEGGRLVVEVDEPGWATQLRFLERELISTIGPLVAPESIERVEVRVAGAHSGTRSRSTKRRGNPIS